MGNILPLAESAPNTATVQSILSILRWRRSFCQSAEDMVRVTYLSIRFVPSGETAHSSNMHRNRNCNNTLRRCCHKVSSLQPCNGRLKRRSWYGSDERRDRADQSLPTEHAVHCTEARFLGKGGTGRPRHVRLPGQAENTSRHMDRMVCYHVRQWTNGRDNLRSFWRSNHA